MWQGIDKIIKGLGGRAHGQETGAERPPAGEWPGVVAQWRPGHAPETIEVRLRRAAVRDRAAAPGAAWDGVAALFADPGLTVSLTSPFLAAPAALDATAVNRLLEFVGACRDTTGACAFSTEVPATAAASDTVCLPVDFRLELRAAPATTAPSGPDPAAEPAPEGDAAGAPSGAHAGAGEGAHDGALAPPPAPSPLAAPARAPEPEWLRLDVPFPPPRAAEAMGSALAAFATAFHQAYPSFRLALRDSASAGHGAADLWVVQEAVLALRRRPGEARCFAPRPVSTQLLSAEGVRLAPFPPQESEPEAVDIEGIDADALLEGFLGDLEQVLRSPRVGGRRPRTVGGEVPPVVPPGLDRHERLVEELLLAGGELVAALGERVGRVFAEAPGEGLTEALQTYVEAMRADLHWAYAGAGILQLDLDADVASDLLLDGDVALRRPGESALQVAAGRVRLRPGEPARLSVLVGRRHAGPGARGGYAEVAPRFVVTHVARAEADVQVDEEGEEHVAWLRLLPLEPEAPIDLGDEATPVPLPVRRFPAPPTLESAAAGAARREAATLDEASGWRYEFSYRPSADYDPGADRVRVTVAYEPETTPPRTGTAPAPRPERRPVLVAALASWRASGPAVLAQLAATAARAPSRADDLTCAALGYLGRTAAALASAVRAGAGVPGEIEERPYTGTPPDRFQLREHEGAPEVAREPGTGRGYVALRESPGGPIAVGPAKVLDVRRLTAAHVTVQLERNAELVPARATASDFVYRVPPLVLPKPIRPFLDWTKPIAGTTVSAGAPDASGGADLRQAITGVLQELLGPMAPGVDASIAVSYAFPAGGVGGGPGNLAEVPLTRVDALPRTADGRPDLAGVVEGMAEAVARELPAGLIAAGAGILVDATVRLPVPGSEPVPVFHAGVWLPLVGAAPEDLGPQYT